MRQRLSLTARFAVVSFVALALLGVSLVVAMAQLLQRQAHDDAVRTAEAYVNAALGERVTTLDWQAGALPPKIESGLATNLQARDSVLRFQLWNVHGAPMFDSSSDDGTASSRPDDLLMAQAGSGSVATAQLAPAQLPTSLRDGHDQTLDVYIPVMENTSMMARRSPAVVGVAEVVLDQMPVLAATQDAVRTIALITILGIALVWILLFRTVNTASRRLRASAEENARLALLDPLTSLPNRRLLNERLELAVQDALRDGMHVGLLLLDVDRFKEINDSLGHDRGDQLLVQVSQRLRAIVRDSDTVARLGGDEFAIVLKTVRREGDARAFADRVLGAFSQPFEIDGLVLHVETSVGLALLPDHADDITTLMKRADVAMYVAKTNRQGVSVYTQEGDLNSPARLVLLGDLRRALDAEDQLLLHFQPKLDLRTKQVVGLEALLRWNHPLRGMISPVEFIPLAEQTGLVHLLTHRVLQLVLSQQRDWLEQGVRIQVAVNLSALNLAEADLDTRIRDLLEEYGVPAELLEFEITESAIVQDPIRAADVLRRIAAMGSTIALDDFGIGNTSISQLRDLPIDTLKIDRSFISDMSGGKDVLVKVVTELAHEFAMVAVAEGVEEAETAERLRELGCDLAQGFLYSRPVAADDLVETLARLADAATGSEHETQTARS